MAIFLLQAINYFSVPCSCVHPGAGISHPQNGVESCSYDLEQGLKSKTKQNHPTTFREDEEVKSTTAGIKGVQNRAPDLGFRTIQKVAITNNCNINMLVILITPLLPTFCF